MGIVKGKNSYLAVVIAAGLSSRMGDFKPLLNIGERPALYRLFDTIRASDIDRIVVVTGHEGEIIKDAIRKYGSSCIETIHNPDYEKGMFGSIQTGVRHIYSNFISVKNPAKESTHPSSHTLGPHSRKDVAALLFLADVPLVTCETVTGLLRTFEENICRQSDMTTGPVPKSEKSDLHAESEGTVCVSDRRPFAVPVYEGKNGHPLLIPQEYFEEILTCTGEGGLKGIRSKYDEEMIKYETNDPGCVLDMDTPEDYARILEYDKNKQKPK